MTKIRRYWWLAIVQGALLITAPVGAHAEEATTDGYVTRKEYDELKAQMLAMKQELDALKKERTGAQKQQNAEDGSLAQSHSEQTASSQSFQGEAVTDMHKQVATEAPPPVVEPDPIIAEMINTTQLTPTCAASITDRRRARSSCIDT